MSGSKQVSPLKHHELADEFYDKGVEEIEEAIKRLRKAIEYFKLSRWHDRQAAVVAGTIDPREFAKQEKKEAKKK